MKKKLRSLFVIEEVKPLKEAKLDSQSKNAPTANSKKERTFIPVLINSISLGVGLKMILSAMSALLCQLDIENWPVLVPAGNILLVILGMMLYLFIIIKSIVDYKKNSGGYISFWKGFFLSYLSATGLLMFEVVINVLLVYFLEANLNSWNVNGTSLVSLVTNLTFGPLYGIFVCLIVSAVLHKNKPVPFRSN